MPIPRVEIVKTCAKYVQKLLNKSKTPALMKYVTRTKRITSRYHHKVPKKKLYKTPLELLVQVYNKIPNEVKYLQPKSFKKRMDKMDFEFTPEVN